MRSLHLLTVVIISLAAAASAAAQSQITTAVIDGTVVDASGAVLPGVNVTATQTEPGDSAIECCVSVLQPEN